MSPYLLAGPAVALIGIVAVMFVMRHKSTEKRSMYSSRRSQIEHKVKAARSRTLAPHGRSTISAVAPRQAWEVGPATSAPAFSPPPAAAPPAYTPPAYTPPAAPAEPFKPAETFTAPPAEEPSWTPAPAEPSWNPSPAPASSPAPAQPRVAPQPAATPSGGGASWSVVGEGQDATAEEPAPKSKGKKKGKQAAATGSAWQLASGEAATEEGAAEEVRAPNSAMAIAQYAVLVVGLVMVLIGVLVMVANSKVT